MLALKSKVMGTIVPVIIGGLMLLTKNFLRFKKDFIIKIPSQTGRVWDLAENRWGYRKAHF